MGIAGLFDLLKKSSPNINVSQFKGKTVAIDAYCWLHEGALLCAKEIVVGEKTDVYVKYCLKYIDMLLSHDIKPILVFDGQSLPIKHATEKQRKLKRKANEKNAMKYIRKGNNSKAQQSFKKSVHVTSSMVLDLIRACRARNVDCIVAPYEADAQLAYFALQGIAHVIITGDSDLLVFGCPRVLFQMDQNGSGILVEKDKLHLYLGIRADSFSDEKFRKTCILSGCDYLPSLRGIGLGKAFQFLSVNTNWDLNLILIQIPEVLDMQSPKTIRKYKKSFMEAEQTFLYQLVYDPVKRRLIPLNPYPSNIDPGSLSFAGKYFNDQIAFELAIGNLDAETLGRLDNYNLQTVPGQGSSVSTKHLSIWSM